MSANMVFDDKKTSVTTSSQGAALVSSPETHNKSVTLFVLGFNCSCSCNLNSIVCNYLLGSFADLVFLKSWVFYANRPCSLVAFLFSYLSFEICSVMGILRLGCALFCKIDSDFLRQIQKFRRLLRRVCCYLWRIVFSQPILNNLEILSFVVTLWVHGCGLCTGYIMGLVCNIWQRSKQITPSASFLISDHFKVSTTTSTLDLNIPRRSISAIFYVCDAERVSLSLVLDLVCKVITLVPLVLFVLGIVMITKTASARSRSSSSSYANSPMPSQPDTFRYRHLKTDSEFHYYLRHFGYYLRHYGYVVDTVTLSWVIGTLIALGNLKFKNSRSCYLHDLRNIGLDLIQSSLYALTHPGFVSKISLALYVWSSPLRERRFSEKNFRSEEIDLISKNWWRYYNLYNWFMILNNFCKVSGYLNRLYQYKF